MELGVKILAASLNIHASFEYFLKTVSGENTEEERKKLLEFLNEMRDERREREEIDWQEAGKEQIVETEEQIKREKET